MVKNDNSDTLIESTSWFIQHPTLSMNLYHSTKIQVEPQIVLEGTLKVPVLKSFRVVVSMSSTNCKRQYSSHTRAGIKSVADLGSKPALSS